MFSKKQDFISLLTILNNTIIISNLCKLMLLIFLKSIIILLYLEVQLFFKVKLYGIHFDFKTIKSLY